LYLEFLFGFSLAHGFVLVDGYAVTFDLWIVEFTVYEQTVEPMVRRRFQVDRGNYEERVGFECGTLVERRPEAVRDTCGFVDYGKVASDTFTGNVTEFGRSFVHVVQGNNLEHVSRHVAYCGLLGF